MEIYVIAIALALLLIAVILFTRRPRVESHTQEVVQLRAAKEALAIELARAQQQAESLVAEKDRMAALFKEELDRKSDVSGKRVSVRVNPGGSSIHQKKN